jgi:hypothetical protein
MDGAGASEGGREGRIGGDRKSSSGGARAHARAREKAAHASCVRAAG